MSGIDIFAVTDSGQVLHTRAQTGDVTVMLQDYQDPKHLHIVSFKMQWKLPTYIKYRDRWYSSFSSWTEHGPDDKKIRHYYLTKENFLPPHDSDTFVYPNESPQSEHLRFTTIGKGVLSLLRENTTARF